jgi:general secretion pathway protein I
MTSRFRIQSRRGFTLLEVLATLLLIGIILPAVVGAVSSATAAAGEAKRKVEAVSLAQSKLAEMQATSQNQQNAASSGDFSPDFPTYQWTASIQQQELNLSLVTVRVTWFARGYERHVELSTMVYSALAATDATGTGTGSTTGTGSSGGGGTQGR